MIPNALSLLTICGLDEIEGHGARGVTHVLSILDPETPDPDFGRYPPHQRTVLRFHDIVEPMAGMVMPNREHVERILAFGRSLADGTPDAGHLLVHCHMGISRSAAAMTMILAQASADEPETAVVDRVAASRAQAWPNLVMIEHADDLLGRSGRLRAAVASLYRRRMVERPDFAEALRRLGRLRELEAADAAALP